MGNRNERSLQKQTRVTETQVVELIGLYQDGDSVYDLGRRFGVHRTTISEHLHRAGVATRNVRRAILSAADRKQALEAARSGMSVRRIAAMVGATERGIARTLDEEGVPRRRSDSAVV